MTVKSGYCMGRTPGYRKDTCFVLTRLVFDELKPKSAPYPAIETAGCTGGLSELRRPHLFRGDLLALGVHARGDSQLRVRVWGVVQGSPQSKYKPLPPKTELKLGAGVSANAGDPFVLSKRWRPALALT